MKTTVEIPDELMRAVKIRAARENRKLKDVLVTVITRGLSRQPAVRRRRAPKPVNLPGGPLTMKEIDQSVAEGRD